MAGGGKHRFGSTPHAFVLLHSDGVESRSNEMPQETALSASEVDNTRRSAPTRLQNVAQQQLVAIAQSGFRRGRRFRIAPRKYVIEEPCRDLRIELMHAAILSKSIRTTMGHGNRP